MSIFFTLFLNLFLLNAQQETDILGNWLQYKDSHNALYNFLSHHSYDLLEKRSVLIDDLHSPLDWKKRQGYVKETLNKIVGPFPEKTDLNSSILRVIEKDGYRIEHIVYESQPGFFVTASMFIPAGLTGKSPAIVYCSGHSAEGYRSPVYLHIILNLVEKGFIVFAFDPVGQGERSEYYNPDTGASEIGGPTSEHSYAGAQAFLSGSSQAMYMIWDGIRAVDYLFSRDEVDTARIGITGRSGGGTQSSYIAAFDDRIYASAPECYITGFTRLLQSIGPQDAEQNFFHGIRLGIDHADLLTVRAPLPALMITTTNDFFSIQGARETSDEVSEVYRAFGKEDNFSMVEDDAGHASTARNREAMYSFFQRHLGNPGDAEDKEQEIPHQDEVRVTPDGQVSVSLNSETVFSLNRSYSEKLYGNLNESRSDPVIHLRGLPDSAMMISGYREPLFPGEPVFSGRLQQEGYITEKYFIKGEGDYVIPYLLMVPFNNNGKAVIYIHPEGKLAVSDPGPEVRWFLNKGFMVLVPDMLGTGELGPGHIRENLYIPGASISVWFTSVLTGRSIVGIHAADLVRLASVLDRHHEAVEIYAVAIRDMSPALLHAAAFNGLFSHVALIEPYTSYYSVVTNRFYNAGFIRSFVAGALQVYDLPDLAASLAPRKLIIAGATDGAGQADDKDCINADLAVIRSGYQRQSDVKENDLIITDSSDNLSGLFLKWIE